MDQLAGLGVPPGQIEGAAQNIPPGGGDNGVGLGMHAAAELIALAGGHLELLPGAAAQIDAVLAAPGRAVIAGRDDLVIADDDRAILAPQTGGAFQHALRNIQIIVLLVYPVHGRSLLRFQAIF